MPRTNTQFTPTTKITSEQARAMWNYWTHIAEHARIRRLVAEIKAHESFETVKPCTLVRHIYRKANNSYIAGNKAAINCLEAIIEHMNHVSMLRNRAIAEAEKENSK